MTPGRFKWLTKLEAEGIATRTRGAVGCHAMRAGLTEWTFKRKSDGAVFSESEVRVMHADGHWYHLYVYIGEQITENGRKALEQAREDMHQAAMIRRARGSGIEVRKIG